MEGLDDVIHVWDTFSGDPIDQLLEGNIRSVEYSSGHVYVDAPRAGLVLLPGSFNPVHVGHKQLLKVATELYGETR